MNKYDIAERIYNKKGIISNNDIFNYVNKSYYDGVEKTYVDTKNMYDDDGNYIPKNFPEESLVYETKDFEVQVDFCSHVVCEFSYYKREIYVEASWSPKTEAARNVVSKAKRKIHAIKIQSMYECAKELGYDVRTTEVAMRTRYSLEGLVARTTLEILNGNTQFRPFVSKNKWHDISNKSFRLWYNAVTGKDPDKDAAMQNMTGPRWYAVLALTEDVLGPIEVDEGTFRRWSTK